MKKLVAALLSLVMLFSLAACGSDASPAKDSPVNDPPTSAEPTAEPTAEPVVEPQPEEPTESTYYGTWEVVSIEQNGISATVEALEKMEIIMQVISGLFCAKMGQAAFMCRMSKICSNGTSRRTAYP